MNWRTDIENAYRNGTNILAYNSEINRVEVVKWSNVYATDANKPKRDDWVMPWTFGSWDDPLEVFNDFDYWCEVILP